MSTPQQPCQHNPTGPPDIKTDHSDYGVIACLHSELGCASTHPRHNDVYCDVLLFNKTPIGYLESDSDMCGLSHIKNHCDPDFKKHPPAPEIIGTLSNAPPCSSDIADPSVTPTKRNLYWDDFSSLLQSCARIPCNNICTDLDTDLVTRSHGDLTNSSNCDPMTMNGEIVPEMMSPNSSCPSETSPRSLNAMLSLMRLVEFIVILGLFWTATPKNTPTRSLTGHVHGTHPSCLTNTFIDFGHDFHSALALYSNTSLDCTTLSAMEILSTQKGEYTNRLALDFNTEDTRCIFIQETISRLYAHCIGDTSFVWPYVRPLALSEHTAAAPLPPPEPPPRFHNSFVNIFHTVTLYLVDKPINQQSGETTFNSFLVNETNDFGGPHQVIYQLQPLICVIHSAPNLGRPIIASLIVTVYLVWLIFQFQNHLDPGKETDDDSLV